MFVLHHNGGEADVGTGTWYSGKPKAMIGQYRSGLAHQSSTLVRQEFAAVTAGTFAINFQRDSTA